MPPAAVLIVFAVPVAVLFPLKLFGVWLLAHQHWVAAASVLVLAKLVGVAVTAFVFKVTRPRLLQLAWFRVLYHYVMTWLDWSHRLVAPIRRRARKLLRMLRSKRTRRGLRLLWRIRRRMRGSHEHRGSMATTGSRGLIPNVRHP
jgi:hypothetical protein